MTTPVSEHVAAMYDANLEREWARMDRHRTEFHITLRALAEHLPPPPAAVLDCGGGPGRYAIELARQGYRVTLFDLSAGNLALARAKAAEAGVTLAGCEQGTALDLGRFGAERFDAVLLMGPLYHLLEAAERQQALAEAHRVLRPGGPLFAAFISRFAAHRDCAGRYPDRLHAEADVYAEILRSGRLLPTPGAPEAFSAYFARPEEAESLIWGAGFELATLLGVEGFVSVVENDGVNMLTGPAWEAWCAANWQVAADPLIFGAVEHLVAVAHKPRWRRVLADIARQLDAAGVRFVVSGGAAFALHGIRCAVRDIDILTDLEGAYRADALFAGHATLPMGYRESPDYRSHFGRYDFDGLPVEVMADLKWREGERWLPIRANTEAVLCVEGAAVCVPWAEEEWLANIRRGRLMRAAQILPHLDRSRLLALLRGEITARMI